MSAENVVFRKIKEISARDIQPHPVVTTFQIASELSVTSDSLSLTLAELKRLRLINFCDSRSSSLKLTLLGTVVKRDK